ncbi:MAG: ABC transporter substrate-binding protein [Bryobacterales bacterium]|nr:ABC transporter substrate-binding protein [Bryobacterales bacterium]
MKKFRLLLLMPVFFVALLAAAPRGGELRLCLRGEPKSLDPLMVTDEPSEVVRYLTSGILLRRNRRTQQLEPELASAWKVGNAGKRITFHLRPDVRFSDGTPFDAADVEYTLRRLADPGLASPAGEIFRTAARIQRFERPNPLEISLEFASPVSALEDLFDEAPLLSSRSPIKEKAVLGPFRLAHYRRGVSLRLERNPNYWKVDSAGARLPYLDAILLEIQLNRDIELTRFRRGELQLISNLDADSFDRLRRQAPGEAVDAGASLESEMLWFNQSPAAPIAEYRKAWFRSRAFRRAISEAISRKDIVRLVFRGLAVEAAGPFSPAAKFWYNPRLAPPRQDTESARKRLAAAGFRRREDRLLDAGGHAVEFSLITNSGNRNRARIAALLQEDLAKLGIKVNVAALDFPALIERLNHTHDYEACLLSLSGIDLDPNDQMNVWLSSSSHHPWNPRQAKPATPWEADIDRLMKQQAASYDPQERKRAVDRLQEIVYEQAPVIYLVHPYALMAVGASVRGTEPSALKPRLLWNAERLYLERPVAGKQ